MSIRQDVEDVMSACLPTAPPPYIRWASRFCIEVAAADWAWIDFADTMTSFTHPLLIGDSGTQKSMVLRVASKILTEAFPDVQLPATMTREATIDHLNKASCAKGRNMPLAYTVIPELGLLFESNDASYNKGKKDFLLELLEGHVMGKGTKSSITNDFPVHCPFACATTPQRLLSIIPSRLDMTDGLPVRFSPVLWTKKSPDDMPPIIQPTIMLVAVNALRNLRKDLVNSGGLRMVHTTQSSTYYDKLVRAGRRDIKALKMHPASFGRAKMNFSRICISEEISNFGVTSTSISGISAKVAYEDALASARDMFKLVVRMGSTEDMRLVLDLVDQAGTKGISKTGLRSSANLPSKNFKEAFESLLECESIEIGTMKGKTKPMQMVRRKK